MGRADDERMTEQVTTVGRQEAGQSVDPLRLARRLLRSCQVLLPARSGGTTILGYHLVGAGTNLAIDIPAADFRRQMEELAETCEVVPLSEAVAEPIGGFSRERPRVTLTFDDGYENQYAAAWPVLRELRLPLTLFVQVDFVAGRHPGAIRSGPSLPPLTWEQVAEMASSELVEIGSHTCTHPDLRRLSVSQLRRELVDSRRELEDRLGRPVESFCYPRGQRSRRVEREVARHYELAVVRGGRAARPGTSPYRLERVPIRRDMNGSLGPVVRSRLWLEEWLAAGVRKVLDGSGGPG